MPSLADLGVAPDLVLLGVGDTRLVDSLKAAAAIGARGAVVFGSANRIGDAGLPDGQRAEAAANLALPGADAVIPDATTASAFAGFAFLEMLVFFGVLLAGFAYLWKRGDLEWVRSTAAHPDAADQAHPSPLTPEPRCRY